MKTSFFATVYAIVAKDLRVELRSRELVNTMVLFSLLAVLVFSFSFELDRVTRREVIPGMIWVTVIFASLLGLNRSMAMERDQGSIDALLLAPIDRSAIFCGKLAGNFLFTLVVGLALLPVMSILFNTNVLRPELLLVLVMGVLGLSTVGTLLAALTVQTRARESLLPIAMLPLTLPVLLAAVRATTSIFGFTPVGEWPFWCAVLLVVDVVFLVLCFLLFGFVIEE